jgi:hypothetical protein
MDATTIRRQRWITDITIADPEIFIFSSKMLDLLGQGAGSVTFLSNSPQQSCIDRHARHSIDVVLAEFAHFLS